MPLRDQRCQTSYYLQDHHLMFFSDLFKDVKLLEKQMQVTIIYCPNTFSSRFSEEANIHTHTHKMQCSKWLSITNYRIQSPFSPYASQPVIGIPKHTNTADEKPKSFSDLPYRMSFRPNTSSSQRIALVIGGLPFIFSLYTELPYGLIHSHVIRQQMLSDVKLQPVSHISGI